MGCLLAYLCCQDSHQAFRTLDCRGTCVRRVSCATLLCLCVAFPGCAAWCFAGHQFPSTTFGHAWVRIVRVHRYAVGDGIGVMFIFLGYIVSVPVGCVIIIPFFHRLQLTSAYEYLSLRFSKTIRIVASFLFITRVVLYVAILKYAHAPPRAHASSMCADQAVFVR